MTVFASSSAPATPSVAGFVRGWPGTFTGLLLATAVAALMLIWPQYGVIGPQTDKALLWSQLATPYMSGLFVLGSALFLLAGMARFSWLLGPGRFLTLAATGLVGGIILARAWETHQVLEAGHWALSNMYEVTLLLLFMVGGAGLWLQGEKPRFGTFLAPLLLAGNGFLWWLGGVGANKTQELVPALQSYWLPWHVLANFAGYACFLVAAAAGVVVLVENRRARKNKPPLFMSVTDADALSYRAIAVGVPLFALAIILGSVWAYEAWGGYWSWDPKETWALVVWLLYTGYLHARMGRGWPETRLAWLAVAGFFVTLFCFVGVNMFLSGLHSYGSLG